ncbi:hypothetical protein [Streptomyces sp. NPDC051546]
MIRGAGFVYWFAWRRHTYVSYHDDIEPLEVPADALLTGPTPSP